MPRQTAASLLLCVLTAIAGCAGPAETGDVALPPAERAVVEGYSRYLFLYFEDLQIVGVDGKLVGGRWADASSISMPAGKHWVQFSIVRNNASIAMCAFEATFEPGHRYKLQHLLHDQALLAHPATTRFRGTLSIDISAPSGGGWSVSVPTECGSTRLCESSPDCPPDRQCGMDPGFRFGTCRP